MQRVSENETKAARRREVEELKRKVREANLKYRAEKARHTDTYKDARIKAQDEEIAMLKRDVAKLRECLKKALSAMLSCAEKEASFTTGSGMSIAMDMARKALKKAAGESEVK